MDNKEEVMKIYGEFLKAQKEIKHALKDSTNPHFKSKYASLEAVIDGCKPILNGHGFVVIQKTGCDEFGYYVETILGHESGESIESKTYLLLVKQDMQGLGSAITYARRYGLMSLLGMAAEDDDGEESSMITNINQSQINELEKLINESCADREGYLQYLKVNKLSELKSDKFETAKNLLIKKIQGKQ